MSVTTKATIASFGGKLLKLSHTAKTTNCEMNFNLYLPPQAFANKKVPLLIYLSGLTCTADNCSEKGFFQHGASKKGIAVLYPDTSPRGLNIAGEDDAYDFGTGAGFYVDATKPPYDKGYNMYSYITEELPKTVFESFKDQIDASRVSITGHSMGGHGALTLFLRNPGKYKSVSAFAPISNPINCPWGQKAFKGYFGEDNQEKWKEHDATELVKKWKGPLNVLIDVGTGDNFYQQGQLLPENFAKAASEAGVTGVNIRYQADYDHSYYTMATFSDDHVEHAAKYLFE
ncbi:esterase, putative [Talaromyces stipitatus ATCC 10500]|uniref:S-formylglutathione hydrolase n=1 Tax=Talaromyces stipitatus (strain ATCC 10500 / CBS 375.48 / QM 6759 / NRRL 1006) TaxID=441959 RepID=B8MFN3_TALSN|nr:esterase, putative [Talaromyces stipitatus ATCC 10500]XP_002484258.1 esterase, putative [Talaromyces stipitatus ATCC 10500]EED17023.1 esterase, putative [Talaromyces stipitatus ATCC 10500]EED17024.1 esterase, putative [Talaromyces stipitatus ATCC 10500]